jgi:hypothetical protein
MTFGACPDPSVCPRPPRLKDWVPPKRAQQPIQTFLLPKEEMFSLDAAARPETVKCCCRRVPHQEAPLALPSSPASWQRRTESLLVFRSLEC